MITSIFYYTHYKPYILSENDKKKSRISSSNFKEDLKSQQNSNTENEHNETSSYYLNKAIKDDVKSYMKNIASNFNGIKGCTNYLALKLNNFNVKENSENSADAMTYFANRYNKCLDFLESDENAKHNLKDYVTSIKNIITDNLQYFNSVGINFDEKQHLIISKDFNKKFLESSKETLQSLKSAYETIYNHTCDTMTYPLSTYMNFKDFSYYFNYSVYNNYNRTFALLQNGILFDIGV